MVIGYKLLRCRQQVVNCIIFFWIVFLLLGVTIYAGAVTMPINNISVSAIKTDSVNISWDSTEAGTSVIEYGLTASYGSLTQEDSLSYFHTQTVSGLAEGTLYHYRIRTKDYNGAETLSGDYTFTTRTQAELEAVIREARADGGLPKTYYVKPASDGGDNNNDGASIDTAWATPSYAVSKADVGDTVYLMDRTYYGETISFPKSGIDVAPITLTAYSGTPTLDGIKITTINPSSAIYFLDGTHDYIISNLKILNYTYLIGTNAVGPVNNRYWNVNITNNSLGNTIGPSGGGQLIIVGAGSSYVKITNNYLYNAGWNTIQLGGGTGPNLTHHILIQNNNFNQNFGHAGGVDSMWDMQYITIVNNYFNPGSIYVHAYNQIGTQYLSFSHNTVYNSRVALEEIRDSIFAYNNIDNSGLDILGLGKQANDFAHNLTLIGNNVKNAADWGIRLGANIDSGNSCGRVTLIDNTFSNVYSNGILIEESSYQYQAPERTCAIVRYTKFDPNFTYFRLYMNNTYTTTLEFTDGRVFDAGWISGVLSTTPKTWYPDRSNITFSGSSVYSITLHPMTARPAAGSATVTVNKFDTALAKGNVLVDFSADTTNGNNIDFVIAELKADTNYQLTRAGVNYHVVKSNANKCIAFSNSEWSEKTFTITETDATADIITPAYVELGSRINHIDLNGDGTVNILDIVLVAQHFGESTASPYPCYDINSDGSVDILDIRLVAEGM